MVRAALVGYKQNHATDKKLIIIVQYQ